MNIQIDIPQAQTSSTATPEQAAVINYPFTGNLICEAVAGSGKSYTLMQRCVYIVNFLRQHNVQPTKLIAILAFNSRIAKELRAKIQMLHLDQWVEVGTVHSFGNTILRRYLPPYRIDGGKLNKLADQVTRANGRDWSLKKPLTRCVSLAKNSGFDVTQSRNWELIINQYSIEWDYESCPEHIFLRMCNELLDASISAANQNPPFVDFDDQLWLPLYKKWEPTKKFPFVLIDEYQDINVVRQQIADLLLDPTIHTLGDTNYGGQMLVVGDRRQAIYGFTGAMADAMDKFKKDKSADELPLSCCFRCDKNIVLAAQKIVPQIQPLPNAADGSVSTIKESQFDELLTTNQLRPTDAILCRKNAPLMSLAFKLLKLGIACKIEGRDIGENLKTLANKWKITTLAQLSQRLQDHYTREIEKQRLADNEAKIDELNDQWDCMRALIQRCQSLNKHTIADLIDLIDSMFSDSEPGVPAKMITLSSVHKSKGLEWPRVFILGRNAYMPAKYARQDWELEQERNLIYVAITRAEHELIHINVEA